MPEETDNEYIARIELMSERELLDEAMGVPEYLTDPYYYSFRHALQLRHTQLVQER